MAVEERKSITKAEKKQALAEGKAIVVVHGKAIKVKASTRPVILVRED